MLALIKKDFRLVTTGKYNLVFILSYVPFLLMVSGFDSRAKFMYLVIVMTFAYMITYTTFSYDYSNKTEIYIESLPVTKKDIVRGKYLFSILIFFISVFYASIYMGIINLILKIDFIVFNLSVVIGTFIIYLLLMGVALPIYYKLPPKIGNFFSIFVYVFLLNMLTFNVNDLDNVFKMGVLSNYGGIIGVVIGIVVFIFSSYLSVHIYRNKTR